MTEHKENKCAMVKVDDTIDITAYSGQNQRASSFFAQQMFFTPDGYQSANLLASHSQQPPFLPFPLSHTHQYPQQQPMYEAPPPSHTHHREEESLHVDPQWLASVADVCGEDNLDQVLAQNMMVQGSYSAAAARSDNTQAHHHGSTDNPGSHSSKLESMIVCVIDLCDKERWSFLLHCYYK